MTDSSDLARRRQLTYGPPRIPIDRAASASMQWNLNYTVLPAWLESNWLFRRLFLYRKLYLTRTRRKHYSQFAEDVSITRLFPGGHRGFFVDVGCYHPRKLNNTWTLYREGWRGVNVDIDAIKIDGFRIVRPEDTSVACAISDSEGEATYYTNGFYSKSVTLDEGCVTDHPTRRYTARKTACRPLTAVLDETDYRDRQIDLLTIDAEYHELPILQSLDFVRYQPKLVVVEMHLRTFPEVEQSDVYRFLAERGYALVGWCGVTLLMANTELQNALANGQAAA